MGKTLERSRPVAECRHCHEIRKSWYRGLCHRCYRKKPTRLLYPQSFRKDYRMWTPAEKTGLRSLFESGLVIKQIAKALDRKENQIRGQLQHMGLARYHQFRFLERRLRKVYNPQTNDRTLAKLLGCGITTARVTRVKCGLPPGVAPKLPSRTSDPRRNAWSPEPTMEQIERTIAEQSKKLPKWWNESYDLESPKTQPVKS